MAVQNLAIRITTSGGAQTQREAARARGALRGVELQAGKTGLAGTAMGSRISKASQLAATRATQVGSAVRTAALPVAALGVAAGKLYLDFDESMDKIHNLVGISQKQLAGWEDHILRMGPELGKSPQELADAMFFITSAGLRGEEALDLLEQSAKASAIGLGEMKDIAKVGTGAMVAYARDNLKASDAMNVLANTVKQGSLETTELAGSVGRLLPLSQKLGVTFNETGAAIAVLSRSGFDASEAGTSLRGVFSAILKPTVDAKEALADVGLTTDDLRRNLQERGLLDTLRLLSDRFKGNDEGLARVIPNIRGLVGAFSITSQKAGDVDKVFESLGVNADTVGKGFKSLSRDEDFKLDQAFARIQAEGIKLGETLITNLAPAVEEVLGILTADIPLDQKLEQLGQLATEAVGKVLPAAVDVGGELAGAIAKGFANTWVDANPLEKVLLGAAAIRLIGGPGALVGSGKLMGRFLGAGIATGAAEGALTGTAGGAAGGAAAGGLAGGLATNVRGALKKVPGLLKRGGAIGVGVAVVDGILDDVASASDERSDDWRKAISGLAEIDTGETLGSFFEDAFSFGGDPDTAIDAANKIQRLKDRLDAVFASGEKIDLAKAVNLRQAARDAGLAGDAYDDLRQDLNQITEKGPDVTNTLRGVVDKLKGQKLDWPAMNDIIQRLQELPPRARKDTAQMVLGMVGELRSKGQITARQAREFTGLIRVQIDGMEKSGIKSGRKLMRELGLSFRDMEKLVTGRTAGSLEATAQALKVFGASGAARVKAEAARLRAIKDQGGDFLGGQAKGGIHRVQGAGLQDSVPLYGKGISAAVAPGEDLMVATRHQRPLLDAAVAEKYGVAGMPGFFRKFDRRHSYERGGIVGLQKGGYPMVSGDTDFVVGLGNALSKMARATGTPISVQSGRRTMSEQAALYAAFQAGTGNLAAAPSPNAPHVRGIAADITPGRERFGNVAGRFGLGFTVPTESWHIELLNAAAGGAFGKASQVAALRLLQRMEVSGPRGAIRDSAQGALDMVVKDANAMLRREHRKMVRESAPPMGMGAPSAAGALSEGEFIKIALEALRITKKFPATEANARKLLVLAKAESRLDPNSLNDWDTNAGAGNPSGGLMHTTESTFRAYHEPGTANTYFDPLASIAASINYQAAEYGALVTHSPYERGGFVERIEKVKERLASIAAKLTEGKLTDKEANRIREIKERLDRKGLDRERRKELEQELAGLQAQREDLSPERRRDLEKEQEQLQKRLETLREKLAKHRERRARRISRKGLHPELAEKLSKADEQIARFDEKIEVASSIAARPTSPEGEDYSDSELAEILGHYGHEGAVGKLDWQMVRRDIAKDQIRSADRRLKRIEELLRDKDTPRWERHALQENRRKVKELRQGAGEVVVEEEGVTGEGGNIFATKDEIAQLVDQPPTEQADDSELADILRQQLEESRAREHLAESQFGVFEQFFRNAPRSHIGSIVPGHPGQEVPIIATGGQGVLTREEMKQLALAGGSAGPMYLLVEDGAVDQSKIRAISGEEYEQRSRRAGGKARRAMHGAPTMGRKAVPR